MKYKNILNHLIWLKYTDNFWICKRSYKCPTHFPPVLTVPDHVNRIQLQLGVCGLFLSQCSGHLEVLEVIVPVAALSHWLELENKFAKSLAFQEG